MKSLKLLAAFAISSAMTSVVSAQTADSTAAKRPIRHSWTSDRREFTVGDVVTVLVDEQTFASQDKNNTASESKKRQLGFGFNTTTPTKSSGTSVGVNSNSDASSQQTGESTRQNRFQTEVSVRVVQVGANGLLKLQGKKSMLVDKTTQEVTITGWVRAQDISSTNLIDGFRVADAELVFKENGENIAAPKGGILGRLLSKFWP